jgi:homoserine dehydrogenase
MSGSDEVWRVGLIGYGTVGSSFAEVLADSGNNGIKVTRVFNRNFERKKNSERAKFVANDAVWTNNIDDLLNAADVDVIVELMGGLDPVEGWLRTALSAGKHVVTANKQLIAYKGPSLFDLARQKKVQLLYGAAVVGGVPVIPSMAQGLSGDKIKRISGIVNGTCNFILSEMEKGAEYGEVLKRAQAAGYAEADPSADVDGLDARAKLCILARLALRSEMNPDDVQAQTIAQISSIDFNYAKELNCTIRQVSYAQLDGTDRVLARVGPMLVPLKSPIATSHDTQNVVVTNGHFGGDVVFSGLGAGGHPTAVAVLSDVLAIADGRQAAKLPDTKSHIVDDNVRAPFYLRFVVKDKTGIISAIATELAKVDVNIDSILQHHCEDSDSLPFVVTTELCEWAKLKPAVRKMENMAFMQEPPLCLQIFSGDDMAPGSTAAKIDLKKQDSKRRPDFAASAVVAS